MRSRQRAVGISRLSQWSKGVRSHIILMCDRSPIKLQKERGSGWERACYGLKSGINLSFKYSLLV